jgi:hypothetical protein
MTYKVGDRVRFKFLGEVLEGTITKKVDAFKWKVKGDDELNYPFVYKKAPNKSEQGKIVSWIIEKL